MFRRVLIPTDGSPTANKAVKAGIELAKQLGAAVTGYYAVEAIQTGIYGEGYTFPSAARAKLEKRAKAVGRRHLAKMARLAEAAGVRFDSVCARAQTPYDGIIDTARRKFCDVIFMGSHGRQGITAMVMGSVTNKVLTKSRIPVLVFR
jgi:nucleotide-binding universal stress UspA family protein